MRDKAFSDSDLLKRIFTDAQEFRGACQIVQTGAVRLHSEAMWCNPAMGGYNYAKAVDSNAIMLDGLVDC